MDEIATPQKAPDEIYCPSCAKPVKKDAVVCPNCGVQIKELKLENQVKILTPEEEIIEGDKQLSGVRGFYWFFIVIFGLLAIGIIIASITEINALRNYGEMQNLIPGIIIILIILALYIIPLVGVLKRKAFAVPFTRVMLIITMFWFPIGTIIGGTLWKRINNASAKKFLNYGD